jgi:hypothetical protein
MIPGARPEAAAIGTGSTRRLAPRFSRGARIRRARFRRLEASLLGLVRELAGDEPSLEETQGRMLAISRNGSVVTKWTQSGGL